MAHRRNVPTFSRAFVQCIVLPKCIIVCFSTNVFFLYSTHTRQEERMSHARVIHDNRKTYSTINRWTMSQIFLCILNKYFHFSSPSIGWNDVPHAYIYMFFRFTSLFKFKRWEVKYVFTSYSTFSVKQTLNKNNQSVQLFSYKA